MHSFVRGITSTLYQFLTRPDYVIVLYSTMHLCILLVYDVTIFLKAQYVCKYDTHTVYVLCFVCNNELHTFEGEHQLCLCFYFLMNEAKKACVL